MQKANLESVKKFLEDDGWKVEVMYGEGFGAPIFLRTNKVIGGSAETFEARFAAREQDYSFFDSLDDDELEEIKDYAELWGDNVIYNGTKAAVEAYEAEFGRYSAAEVQVVTSENEYQVEIKPVSMVEDVFKKAGYVVNLNVSDKGDAIEHWSVACMCLNPINTLDACFGYDEDWARDLAEGQISAAQMSNQTLKVDGCWFYRGTADAVALFESFGVKSPEVLHQAKEIVLDPGIAAMKSVFEEKGCRVTITPIESNSMISCIDVGGADHLTAGNGDADFISMYSGMMKPGAEQCGLEMKLKGNWYYYGTPEFVKLFESVI